MPNRREFLATAASSAFALRASAPRFPALLLAPRYDLVIRRGVVFDGSGGAGSVMDVAISGDRIATIARRVSGTGAREIDARDRAVAPGFIDIHSHADGTLWLDPNAESVVRQGVTTVVVGQDG
jgi:N-acyl-D-amino-acid deacylase